MQCKQVLTCSGQLRVPVPFPGQTIWVVVLVPGLGFTLGQQGISFWGTVSVLILFYFFFPYFAGKEALGWVIPLIVAAVVFFGLVVFLIVKKLKCNRGNCLIIICEICFPELGKACTRAIPGSCVALQGICFKF